MPAGPNQPYDVRELVADVVDDGDLLELRPGHAPAIVTALARIDGRPVGIVANQPLHLAGTLDIDASRKAAALRPVVRRASACRSSPSSTRPGFLPGVEQEWRGMIRHGAQLAFAYALATVPRLCVVVRKAYGGAYIVMDAKGMGNDLCVTWPGAELAVMGPSGAVADPQPPRAGGRPVGAGAARGRVRGRLLHAPGGARAGLRRPARSSPTRRGRSSLAACALAAKRERLPERKHDNTPL